MSDDETKAAALVIASGGRLDLETALAYIRAERRPAGCTGDCADQAPCNCSHATFPRIPRGPTKHKPGVVVMLWRWLSGPRP
jgi:hypothetical protein